MAHYARKLAFLGAAVIATGGVATGCASSAKSVEASTAQASYITEAEKKIGSEAHPKLLEEFGGAYQVPQTSYVVEVGKSIALQSGLGNAREDFTVTLLNSPVNNAFAIPGGYIYVTRQLLGLMNDEAELAGVMGHEVGHVAARHSQKRQKAASRNAIFGLLGQIGSALLLGNTAAGQLGQQLFGTGSQLLTLKYSRKQEEEADDLGIRYLSGAGYDPKALSSMLASLAAQSAIDVRAAGRDARSVPEWASTHPDPARRVARATNNARNYSGSIRKRTEFMRRLDGMLYGDDPKQGVIQGQNFVHPDLRLQFTVPQGYGMQNGATAVTVSGQTGQAQFTTQAYSGDLNAYVANAFAALSTGNTRLAYGQIQRTTVNGLPAAYSTARVVNGRETLDVLVFAYAFGPSQAFHFVTAAPAGRLGVFDGMFSSVRRLTPAEADAVKSRRLRIVTVQPGDTVASLARRMAFTDLQVERFRALNGLSSTAEVTRGDTVKLVVY